MNIRRARASAFIVSGAMVLSLGPATAVQAHKLADADKQRRHIEERALSQKGTRYTSGGERPRSGFDCSGFTSWVFEGHGANLGRTARSQFKAAYNKGNRRIWKRSKLRKGDLVFFKTTSARVGHAGIYIGRGRFISSTSSSGVRVDSVYDPYYWGRRWVGATRHRITRDR